MSSFVIHYGNGVGVGAQLMALRLVLGGQVLIYYMIEIRRSSSSLRATTTRRTIRSFMHAARISSTARKTLSAVLLGTSHSWVT